MSWLDRLVRSIHRLGIPSWALFLAVFAFLASTIMIGKWTDGTVPFPMLHPGALNGFYLAAGLAAYGLLTRASGRALDRLEPVLDGQVDTVKARHVLTSMPMWQSLVAFAIGAGVAGALMAYVPAYTANIASPSTPTLIVGIVGFAVSYGVATITTWQCLRTIATVVHLHRHVPRVDLLRPGPAHAFAPVTAGAGVYSCSTWRSTR